MGRVWRILARQLSKKRKYQRRRKKGADRYSSILFLERGRKKTIAETLAGRKGPKIGMNANIENYS